MPNNFIWIISDFKTEMRITLQKRYNSHLRDKNVTILTYVTKTWQKRDNSHLRDKNVTILTKTSTRGVTAIQHDLKAEAMMA